MTSSERISTPRATASVAPTSTPKAASPGVDDFAATLNQARTGNPASASSASTAKSSAASEGATEELESESTTTSRASKGAKASRASREPKEAEKPGDREDAAVSAGQLPAEVVAALNAATTPPPALPAQGSPEGEVIAQSSSALESEVGRAALAIAGAASGAAAASPAASALVGSLLGPSTPPTATVRGEQSAPSSSRALPGSRLVASAGELRATVAQLVKQGADQSALAAVTDALQAAVSVTEGNAASAANVLTPLTAAPDGAANAALLQLTSATSSSEPSSLVRHAQSLPQHALHTPVGAQGWSDELATRLTWMVDQHQSAATLRLSPENMGPLEVRIDVRENQVSVWFGAAQADTRAAIESALPRLREMLQGQGLSLADAGVFQQSHRESPKHLSSPQGTMFNEAEGVSEMNVALRVGLFDGYA